MKSLFHFLPVALLLLAVAPVARGASYAKPAMLVEPAELAKPEVARQFIILDVRPAKDYEAGHVPGALRVDHEAWSKAFGEGTDAAAWSALIGELGIDAKSKVVVYDGKGIKEAGRVWWILRYWGVADARLLNGDWKTWQAAKLPVSKEPAKVKKASFAAQARRQQLADKAEMLGWINSKNMQVVDARSEKEFCGIDAQNNRRAGAMPGAKHLDWTDLIDAKTHQFKSADQLQRLFDGAGIDPAKPTVSHCQSGGRASVMVFALELMGGKDVRNYYKSWAEWGNADDTPIVATKPKAGPALAFTMASLGGKSVELGQYQGKVVLVVNVASKCGLTPQYKQIQALYEKYKNDGLVILGFPCDQFGHQEPGTSEEIRQFCTLNYGVSFPLFGKIEVNGDGACPLYKYLTALATKPAGAGKIAWNFEKFLVGRDGQVVARFAPRTKPDAPEVIQAIEAELKKK